MPVTRRWSRCLLNQLSFLGSSYTCSCRLRCSTFRLWSERVGRRRSFYYEFSYFLVLDSSARSFCSPGQTAQPDVEPTISHPLPAAQLLGHWATHTLNPALFSLPSVCQEMSLSYPPESPVGAVVPQYLVPAMVRKSNLQLESSSMSNCSNTNGPEMPSRRKVQSSLLP